MHNMGGVKEKKRCFKQNKLNTVESFIFALKLPSLLRYSQAKPDIQDELWGFDCKFADKG